MQEVIIKKDNSIKLDTFFHTSLNPRFIFLPIKKGYKLLVQDNDYVYKNDKVIESPLGGNVYSSISGNVLGIKEMTYYNNVKMPSLVIENDFKENTRKRHGARKYIGDCSKREFVHILKDASIMNRGSETLKKFRSYSECIIINAVELEPYFGNKYFILKKHIDEILETSDLIYKLTGAKRMLFVIKNNESELIGELTNILGTYPNISLRLISDAYPNGREELLKRYYKEPEACVIDIEEIWNIYEVLKKNLPVTEKFITISGNAVKPTCVVKVKIGSLLSEVFVGDFDFTKKSVDVYLNGMMGGEIVNNLKYVIDSNIEGIIVMDKVSKEKEACINCGLCSRHCPVGLNPKYVFDHEGRVKSEYYDTCLQCGLCNHMCPSNIDLKKYMKGAFVDEKKL